MMDFLDPKKTRAYVVRLYIGYVLLGIAVILATIILLYQARGYGYDQGKVIQSGLVFVSSNPGGADIYLNGKQYQDQTNSRLILPADTYTIRLSRTGYRDWQRAVSVAGGSVDRFDYPLLIPKQLTSSALANYDTSPSVATESPDRRWLLVQTSNQDRYEVYDLRDPKKTSDSKEIITVPASIYDLPDSGKRSLKLVEWSRDNDHVLLRHTVGAQSELVMVSRTKPEESYNLTKKLKLSAGAEVSLQDKKPDRFFVHDKAGQTLSTATLDQPALVPLIKDVIDYKSYGTDVVIYATNTGAAEGKVSVKLYQDGKSYPIRQVAKSDKYLLDISTYGSDWYAALGTPEEDHVYIYKNVSQNLQSDPTKPLVPVEILKLKAPNYIEFSANSQYVMAENGQDVATYDAENERSYTFKLDRPIDAPQESLTWMDSNRLRFVSQAKATILDYDGTNIQTLVNANPTYLSFFDTGYTTLYTLTPITAADGTKSDAKTTISATPLRTEQDR
jgi:hypothetical protein